MATIDTQEPLAVAVVEAIQSGEVPALQRLLDEHPGLAAARLGDDDPEGMSRTLLHVATDWPGHFPNGAATVAVLVAAGADVNARFRGPHAETPLHWAASSNDVEVLDALIDAGADLEAPGAATLDGIKRRVVEVMAGFAGPWWVAGGWALDLFLGRRTRPHADLEISVLAADQEALFEHLSGWDLRLAAPGASLPAWDGSWIQPSFHQVWARRGPARPSGPDEFAADPTMLDFLLEQSTTGRWVFRRHPAVTRPLAEVGTATADGVAVVRPEIAVLFKAKGPRFKDQRDFDRVLPYLDGSARAWLRTALAEAHPGHAWRGLL